MSHDEFGQLWKRHFPEVIPANFYLRESYAHRWFRIHSLPESKRYASEEDEYQIILDRQNTVISDLLGESAEIFVVTGRYGHEERIEQYSTIYSYALKYFHTVNLHDSLPQYFDENELYSVFVGKSTWNKQQHDTLLRTIADWEETAFWVSFENNVIISPYDGGMDIILKDTETRDLYKLKYQNWLSSREDGL